MIADWIRVELRNWAAYCHSGPLPHPLPPDCALSLEGKYIAPTIYEEEYALEQVATRPIPPDRKRAEVVQFVYDYRLTARERRILVDRYIKRPKVDKVETIRQLRITREMYEIALGMAAKEIGRAFRCGEFRCGELRNGNLRGRSNSACSVMG